jgi:DNA-binding NarL/FixJ family response regulator
MRPEFSVSIRVLLADDHESVRTAVSRLLKSDPEIELVAEAASFVQAVQLTAELQPHVVVIDLHMRDEGHVSPLAIKSSLADAKVLAISIWNDDDAKALAHSFGALTLLDKINLAHELIPTIKQCAVGSQ